METLQKTSTCHGQAAIQHPLVSVVMPAYNAEKYIGEAIRSVQSQTYANWLRGVKKRVEALQAETASLNRLVKKELDELKALKKQEYSSFSGTEAKKLATMMNNGQSLKEKVVEIIPLGR